MKLPDWRTLVLSPGVLPEPIPEDNRIVLWLPGKREGRVQHWERISSVARAEVTIDQGLCAAPATALRARQSRRGWLGKLMPRSWQAKGEHLWTLPKGQTAEQGGERQTDLLLVWAGSDLLPVDEARLRSRWPEGNRFQQLGENLFLVAGVAAPGSAPEGEQTPPQGCPRQQVEHLLAAARQSGDRRREALALTDRGIICRRSGEARQAVALLEEALGIVRQLGERSWERDVVGNLGLAHLAAGRPQQALALFDQELADAHAAGDPFGEKAALEHLGLAYRNLGAIPRAIASFEQALPLACAVKDGQHEADLLWYLAILHAEVDQRDQAVTRAQAAVNRLEEMRKPQARWLADQLHKYRLGEGGDSPAGTLASGLGSPPGAVLGTVSVVGSWAAPPEPEPAAGGPGVLRLAFSAAKALAKFVGAGCKTVAPESRRRRLQTCAACAHHTGARCRLCGCFTDLKTWLPHERCPLGKWPG